MPLRRARLHAAYAWQQSADPRLAAVRSWMDSRVRTGTAVVSTAGPAASLGYAGVRHGVERILQVLEQRRDLLGARTAARSQHHWDRAALLAGQRLPPADLIAVGCTPAQAERLPRQAALVLPYRLHLVVDLPAEAGGWRQRVSKKERNWFRTQLRSRGWALEVATAGSDFDFFYDRMHVPTMRLRHGERTRSEARDSAYECLFRGGLLAFVTLDGTRVAGALCRRDRHGTSITLRLVGVRDGAPHYYDQGALRMCYPLLLEWADGAAVRHVDLGGTEAFLGIGIVQWKRKFRPRAILAPNHLGRLRVWWHARRDTAAVRDFLAANPVLELAGERGLRAVYFHDDQRPPRLDLAGGFANVEESRLVNLDEFLAGAQPATRMERTG